MKFARLFMNLVVGSVLAALIVLVIFAHLSARVRPAGAGAVMVQVDFKPGAWKAMRGQR
jgi:hypothetical protein